MPTAGPTKDDFKGEALQHLSDLLRYGGEIVVGALLALIAYSTFWGAEHLILMLDQSRPSGKAETVFRIAWLVVKGASCLLSVTLYAFACVRRHRRGG